MTHQEDIRKPAPTAIERALAFIDRNTRHPMRVVGLERLLLAQSLSYFHRIEERGSGFRRMRDQMIDHGLEDFLLGEDTGYFQVTFKGPGPNIDRLKISTESERQTIPPSIVERLNDRQKKMIVLLLKNEVLTSSFCEKKFGITRPTAVSDFVLLVKLGLAVKQGKGRSTHYVLALGQNR
ncbi:MAG: hypothetical protein Q8O01_02475 [Candidatus Omnitrophota bacterium]|nr:hypothetical protein [Candidatus Omnitrophota bacterium]